MNRPMSTNGFARSNENTAPVSSVTVWVKSANSTTAASAADAMA